MGVQKFQVGAHGAFQLMLKDARALDQQLAHFLIIQPYLILQEVQLAPDGWHPQLQQAIVPPRRDQLCEVSLGHSQVVEQRGLHCATAVLLPSSSSYSQSGVSSAGKHAGYRQLNVGAACVKTWAAEQGTCGRSQGSKPQSATSSFQMRSSRSPSCMSVVSQSVVTCRCNKCEPSSQVCWLGQARSLLHEIYLPVLL